MSPDQLGEKKKKLFVPQKLYGNKTHFVVWTWHKYLFTCIAEQSRRDDLESLGFVLMYFNRGDLPWQGLKARTKKQKYARISEKKISTPVEVLCRAYPSTFLAFLQIQNVREILAHDVSWQNDIYRPRFGYIFRQVRTMGISSRNLYFSASPKRKPEFRRGAVSRILYQRALTFYILYDTFESVSIFIAHCDSSLSKTASPDSAR